MSATPPRRPIIPIRVAPSPPPSACCDDAEHEHAHGSAHGQAHEQHHDHGHHDHRHANADRTEACCAPVLDARPGTPDETPLPQDSRSARWRIDKMDCPTEERLIRNRLEPMDGVLRLDFNLIGRELTVHHRLPDAAPLEAALNSLDMAPQRLAEGARPQPLPPALPNRTKAMLALGGIAATGAELAAWATGHDDGWPVMLLAVVAIATAGLPTLKKGWIALRHATLNIYFLMTLAVGGAVVIGKWPEAAMVVFLFAVAEAIEAVSLERARKAIESLSALAPETAWVMRRGQWQQQGADSVAEGDVIRVRAGERIALDGRVQQGQAAVDQAPITGESLPVDKQAGDTVYAGTIVTDGIIEVRVTATAGHSTLARIGAAIQAAQAQRAPTQRFVDQFARYYTPIVVIGAALVALAGPWLMGGSAVHWLYQALVLLVIACPCALVVSTPVTVVSGLANAARHGILIKGGTYLEQGRRLKAIALDKTGTLTEGRPSLTDVIVLGDMNDEDALTLAASLDQHSSHPLAKALVAAWRQRHPNGRLQAVTHFEALAGRGVKGRIEQVPWQLGNHRLVHELGLCSPDLEGRLQALEQQGKTAFVLLGEQGPQALIAMADTLRPHSCDAVARLRSLGLNTLMLTGDNQATAEQIGRQCGIDDVRGNLLSTDKLEAINALLKEHGAVGMVGDGVNDAPALARATIGIAMGAAGSATALETADVAIMDDDPRKLAAFIRLSQAAARVLKQNIALALGIKAIFLALALTDQATLWMAVFADMGASLLVVFNGLRLLRLKA